MTDKIWYTCYGSNLFTDRFITYIKGGIVPGTSIVETGCRDKSNPIAIEKFILPYELFFAGHSARWNKQGVGFISSVPNSNVKTYGKRYLITKEQFSDVVCQENNIAKEAFGSIYIPEFNEVGDKILFPNNSYGRVVCVGFDNDIPILTFTSVKETLETATIPSIEYLNMIANGIHQTHQLSKEEIVNYFLGLTGVRDEYSKDFLIKNITIN